METPVLIQLQIGYTNPVLIVNGSNSVLVDTGPKGSLNRFRRYFSRYGLEPADIRLIILTHTHFDHTGNLAALQKLTGAKVVVNLREAGLLRNGSTPIPRGTNLFTKGISLFGRTFVPRFAAPEPFVADVEVDTEMDLSPWGLEARIIHTPGHTEGSQSVIAGKNLIAGDCFFNIYPHTVFPVFANQPHVLLETWEKLFASGIEQIYPGHGRRFPVKKALETYKRLKKE